MRRVLLAALFVMSSVGIYLVPASADPTTLPRITLSYDFSDNGSSASASGGTFYVAVDVLPEETTGVIRVVAIAPGDSGVSNLVCRFQTIDHSHVRCGFDFTAPGTWAIRSQFAPNESSDVSAVAITNIRVGY